jgi:tetratricopeptide (TPR) repeat protein
VAVALLDTDEHAEAIAQWRELLRVQEKVLGPDDFQTLNTMMNLGYALAESGEYQQGEAILRRTVEGRERTLGPDKHKTLYCRYTLAMTLAAQGKVVEAEREARDIVRLNDKSQGAEREGWVRDMLGDVLDKQGRHAEAEAQIRQALRVNEKGIGSDRDETRASRGHLAKNLWYQGRNAEAESLIRELIILHEKVLGPQVYALENNVSSRLYEELTPFLCRTLLANTLRDQQKYDDAEAEYKQVIELEEKVLGPQQRDTLNACYNYAYQLVLQGKVSEAKPLADRAAKGAVKVLGANDPNTREYVKFLELLDNSQPITTPNREFHETFLLGKQT